MLQRSSWAADDRLEVEGCAHTARRGGWRRRGRDPGRPRGRGRTHDADVHGVVAHSEAGTEATVSSLPSQWASS